MPARPLVHRSVLPNGITVLATENPAADIIAARLFVKAGSRWETADQAGISHLVAAVLTKGTDTLSALEIAERVESIGASLGTDASTDYFLLSLKTVSADFPEMLALAAELLRSPSFPDREIETERRLTLQGIRSQREQPFNVAFDQLRRAMYADHPYALSSLGTEATVANLTRSQLQVYHQTYFRPDNLIISLCGRLNPQDAIAWVEDYFGDWQIPNAAAATRILPSLTSNPQRTETAQETQQAIVMLGYLAPGVHRYDVIAPDYAALKLLSSYLGNGLSSRLFVELREKRGLAYEVSSFYPTRLEPAQFAVYMGTAPDNTAIALDGLRTEVDRLCLAPLRDEELEAAKSKLLGQYALSKQTNAQIAQTYGWYEALGLGLDFDITFQQEIADVTVESAYIAASQYLTNPYISVVGPDACLAAGRS